MVDRVIASSSKYQRQDDGKGSVQSHCGSGDSSWQQVARGKAAIARLASNDAFAEFRTSLFKMTFRCFPFSFDHSKGKVRSDSRTLRETPGNSTADSVPDSHCGDSRLRSFWGCSRD